MNHSLIFKSKAVRYVVSGGTAAAVNLGLTWLLERAGFQYLAVVTMAFIAALLVSFVLQKFFTFGDVDKSAMHFQFAFFLVLAVINLLVNDLLVYAQHDFVHVPYLVLQEAIASIIIAVYSFFVYKVIFKKADGAVASDAIPLS